MKNNLELNGPLAFRSGHETLEARSATSNPLAQEAAHGCAMELNEQRKGIIDFIQFEDATSLIWPWAVSADTLLKSEPLLQAIEKAVHFDSAGQCDTDELYWAIDRIVGVNPVIEPKLPFETALPHRETDSQKQKRPKGRDR